ncbi:hypothetical protein B566_EDAN013222 [Ephemera danica]|nr:hypothetical protein B566_EDAN013222 [Ephemera danica]
MEQSERTQFIIDKMQNSICQHVGSFGGNFSSYQIIKIQHVKNRLLFRDYVNRRNVIARENGGNPNEMQMFHGSSVAKDIAENGFDERYSRISIYFADHSSKSNQYAFGLNGGCIRHNDNRCMQCERLMLLCRVTMGKVAEFTTAQKLLAHAPPGYHSVKGVPSPGILAYPEYIVYRGEQVRSWKLH